MDSEKKLSQCNQILDHMKRAGSITPLVALQQYGCMRLPARILDLKKKGYSIEGEIIKSNDKHFSEYRLVN